MGGAKKSISQEVFVMLVKEEWGKLPNEIVLSNINGMSDRIQACIEADGEHTKY